MPSQTRRELLQAAAALAAGGAAAEMISTRLQRHPNVLTPFELSSVDSIPIAGTDELFPVRRIYCVGRNYAAHAREMGSDPTREPPFFFQKPTDAIQSSRPAQTRRPSVSADHEELPLRDRAGRRARKGGGATSRSTRRWTSSTATRVGPRHDAARPAARDGRPEEAVGDGQELRPVRGDQRRSTRPR